jgi:hypothetical protein
MKWSFIYLLFILLLASCRPISYSNNLSYTLIGSRNCNKKANAIFLFFEGEQTNFSYSKIALLHVNETFDEQTVYNLMKEKAFDLCGNAIINIKTVYTPEIYTDRENKLQSRNIKSYTGIVVSIDENSDFLRKNNAIVDTGFLEINRSRDAQLNNPASRIFGIFVSTIVALYYILMELPE